MAIKPIGKNIIFVFKDKVNTKGEFIRPPTASGIELLGGYDDSAKQSRWGVVIAVGPDCVSVQPGQEILMPALRWTNGITVGDQRFWKTDEKQVVAFRTNSDSATFSVIGEFIAFIESPRKALKSALIIVPTRDTECPAEGVVVLTGTETSEELVSGVTLYFSDANFQNYFDHSGQTYAFITDSEVFAFSVNE